MDLSEWTKKNMNNIILAIRKVVGGAFGNVCFQQDEELSHYTRVVRNYLDEGFTRILIGEKTYIE